MSMSNLYTDPPGGADTSVEDYIIQSVTDYAQQRQSINNAVSADNPQSNNSSNIGGLISALLDKDWGKAGDIVLGWLGGEANYQRNKRDFQEQFKMNQDEYDRRFNMTNQYNADWANRMKAQGINPLSAVSQGVTGSSASMQTQSSFSGPLSNMTNLLDSLLTGSQIKNTEVNTNVQTFEARLKEQMYNYNETAYPILLEESQQRVNNAIQEYNNLVAKENYDKASADELRQRILTEQAQYELLVIQQISEKTEIKVKEARLKQMAQDFETGKFVQEYERWHAEHEKNLARLAETQGKITDAEFEQFYESGLFGDLKEQELANLKQMYNKLYAETGRESAEWQKLVSLGLGDNSKGFAGGANRIMGLLLYLVTELI